jgi:endonuclease-3
MVAANRGKSVDKQEVCKKLQAQLKKHYGNVAPLKTELPVLETLLYALCLEDATPVEAEQAYARILNGFHDLNEVRVSSIYELEAVFEGLVEPGWRALRLKNVLQFVFESTFSFDFDGLKRKPQDQAVKTLTKINHLTPFARNFTLQTALGVHVVPIDGRMRDALAWLGMADPEADLDTNSDALRSAVRKADAVSFCNHVRAFSTDPKYLPVFAPHTAPIHVPADEATHRLDILFKQGVVAAKKLDVQRHIEAQKLWDEKLAADKEAADRKAARSAAKDARDALAAEKAVAAEKAAKSAARAAAKVQAAHDAKAVVDAKVELEAKAAVKPGETRLSETKPGETKPGDTSKAHDTKASVGKAGDTKVATKEKPKAAPAKSGDASKTASAPKVPSVKSETAKPSSVKSTTAKPQATKAASASAKPSKPAPKKGK